MNQDDEEHEEKKRTTSIASKTKHHLCSYEQVDGRQIYYTTHKQTNTRSNNINTRMRGLTHRKKENKK